MGNDAPLAVLSEQPKLPFEYFKQLFAQVTNPPIDPIREELVMSLVCPVGPEGNVLDATAEHAKRLLVEHPVISTEEMAALKTNKNGDWTPHVLDATFPAYSGTPVVLLTLSLACAKKQPMRSVLAKRQSWFCRTSLQV
ncbi:hypothetical protein PINS_up019193 [Pythium insidiosum]|nr:hypothetical protein PINS_up019193 [Pythium insidiosum]